MKKFVFISLLICAGVGTELFGQPYSLDNCIDMALRNNIQLANSSLDVIATGYKIKEVKSSLLPTVEMTGQSLYYNDLPGQYVPSSAFGSPDGTYNRVSLNMKQTTTANIQLSQNLFNQSVMIGLKSAKVAQEASLLSETATRENVVYQVSATYYNIQVLQDNLMRLEENITNLEKTTEINAALKDNELVSENVHNRMLINLENLRNQREIQKLSLDESITYLKYLMNISMDEVVIVEPFTYEETWVAIDTTDIDQRTDIRLEQTQLTLAQFDKKLVKAGYFPVLVNSVSFGYSGFNDEFGPFNPINNDWIKSSSIALTLKIPVFDGFKKQNQMRQKEIEIQKHIGTLSMMRLNANKEINDALTNLNTNKTLVKSSKQSLELAEALFASEQGQYSNGLTSSTELLNAQNDLSSARNNYSAALLNLKLAELSLRKANGTLLSNIK